MKTTFKLSSADPHRLVDVVEFVDSTLNVSDHNITFGELNFETYYLSNGQQVHSAGKYNPSTICFSYETDALMFRLKFNELIIGEEVEYEETID